MGTTISMRDRDAVDELEGIRGRLEDLALARLRAPLSTLEDDEYLRLAIREIDLLAIVRDSERLARVD
jgi:hypothetical protein